MVSAPFWIAEAHRRKDRDRSPANSVVYRIHIVADFTWEISSPKCLKWRGFFWQLVRFFRIGCIPTWMQPIHRGNGIANTICPRKNRVSAPGSLCIFWAACHALRFDSCPVSHAACLIGAECSLKTLGDMTPIPDSVPLEGRWRRPCIGIVGRSSRTRWRGRRKRRFGLPLIATECSPSWGYLGQKSRTQGVGQTRTWTNA